MTTTAEQRAAAAERRRRYVAHNRDKVNARAAARRKAAARLKAALTAVSLPDLPRAACRGNATLFDAQRDGERAVHTQARHERAVGICGGCAELVRCRQWVEGLKPSQRVGVLAGHVHE